MRSPRLYLPVVVAVGVLAAVEIFGVHSGGGGLSAGSQGGASANPATGKGNHAAAAGGAAGAAVTSQIVMTSPNAAGIPLAANLLPKLSAAQLAGQRVIYSYAGLTPPAWLLSRISHGLAAGVIFFGDNIGTSVHFRAVVSQLKQAARASTNPVQLPLLLMTDQEGGTPGAAQQYAQGVTRLPGMPYLSAKLTGTQANAVADGRGAAQTLLSVGLNVNLAPVLDVYRNAGNFIDSYGRSFSSDLSVVSRLGTAYATAEQKLQVAATLKHFPGLGSATLSQNTDLRPVTISTPLTQLRQVDELPYRAAITSNVKMVMVSWAVYPRLDPTRPAGLSAKIIGTELRQRLGFGGVTITDALEAGALNPYGAISTRASLAAQAGMDLILCGSRTSSEGDAARLALQGLYGGYKKGSAGQTAFQAAVQRILALRATLAP